MPVERVLPPEDLVGALQDRIHSTSGPVRAAKSTKIRHTCAERGEVMPVRALTPEEEARLLTPAQVAALPDGTAVMIKWAGGNGPHRYYLRHWQGRFFGAVTMGDAPLSLDGELRTIGWTPCQDRVFLPIDEVTP
jgi:hypothetical protein